MDTRRAITVTTCHYRKYKRISSLPSGEPPSGLRAEIARVPTPDKTKTEAGNASVNASMSASLNVWISDCVDVCVGECVDECVSECIGECVLWSCPCVTWLQ